MSRIELNIFLSSPGDVADERGLARKVIDSLSKEPAYLHCTHIRVVSWDDPNAHTPMDAHLPPQAAIDQNLAKPSECDIVVVILWSRMGTPLPVTHKQKPDGTAYQSGTEYEFHDALEAARHNNGTPTVLLYRRTESPSGSYDDPDHEQKVDQYKKVKAFFAGLTTADGAQHCSVNTYSTPSDFAAKLEDHLRNIIHKRVQALGPAAVDPGSQTPDADANSAEPALWTGNPYRGLQPFASGHAAIFFGRGREADELLQRVADPVVRLIAVTGASGSGKSSLVAAGLLPRLADGAIPGSQHWAIVRFTPAEHGDDPFNNLGEALSKHWPDGSGSWRARVDPLRTNPAAIEKLAQRVLNHRPAGAELLLFADQFEELFTARIAEAHRGPFIDLIDAIGHSRRIRLVLTLRADYYEHCTRDDRLAAHLRAGSFPLAAPSARALQDIIERPARLVGVSFEPGLVDEIVKDVGDLSGALALVEFTLERLYQNKHDHSMTLTSYTDVGRIGGIIKHQADLALLQPADATLDRLFQALADVDEEGGAVRKRALLAQFPDANDRTIIDGLVKQRILTTSGEQDDPAHPWVEVAHEAVLRHWPRFTDWLTTNRRFLLWRKRLQVLMETGTQLRDAPLAEARGWYDSHAQRLNPAEQAFVEASMHADRQRKSRLRAAIASAFIAVTASTVWLYPKAAAEWERRKPIYNAADYVLIKPGEFTMGSEKSDTESFDSERDEQGKPHRVRIKAFKLSRYEVTFEEYDHFAYATGARPPSDSGLAAGFSAEDKKRLPVINVSWEDAQAYAHWLSQQTGKNFRLPSEAEWEYAARAGTTTRRYWGDDAKDACQHANVFDARHEQELKLRYNGITWESHPCDDDYATLAPVGRFAANDFELHDMLGNVWEWVADCWHDNYQGAPEDGSAWQSESGGQCLRRVMRGGSWNYKPRDARSAYRYRYTPDNRFNYIGFRLAQDI